MSHKQKHPGLKQRLRKAARLEREAILNELPYQVGYGKPPEAGRFSSSNQPAKRGGRKRCKDPLEILLNELSERIEVTEHGRPRKMSKLQVGARQFANKVATGDAKAFTIALGILRQPSPCDGTSDADVSKAKFEDSKRSVREQMRKLLQARTQDAGGQPGAPLP
jgi:Family of unknown function (DUF5681)